MQNTGLAISDGLETCIPPPKIYLLQPEPPLWLLEDEAWKKAGVVKRGHEGGALPTGPVSLRDPGERALSVPSKKGREEGPPPGAACCRSGTPASGPAGSQRLRCGPPRRAELGATDGAPPTHAWGPCSGAHGFRTSCGLNFPNAI